MSVFYRSNLPKAAPEHLTADQHVILTQLAQLTVLAEAEWCEEVVPRPCMHFGSELANAPVHNLPELDVLAYSALSAELPEPLAQSLHLTESQDAPDSWPMPPYQSAERWFVSMHVASIAKSALKDERHATQRLLSLASLYFALAAPVILVEVRIRCLSEPVRACHVALFSRLEHCGSLCREPSLQQC